MLEHREGSSVREQQPSKPIKKAFIFAALAALTLAAARCGGRRGEYIGTFDVSHYCLETWSGQYHICGNSAYGCEGDKLSPDRSLAAPASVLEKYPVGTKVLLVYPDGSKEKRVIEDTGRALERLHRLDLPVKTHREAVELGVIEGVELYTLE